MESSSYRSPRCCGMLSMSCLVLVWCILCIPTSGASNSEPTPFEMRDPLPIVAAKIYSVRNPLETYRYSSLGFCTPSLDHDDVDREEGREVGGTSGFGGADSRTLFDGGKSPGNGGEEWKTRASLESWKSVLSETMSSFFEGSRLEKTAYVLKFLVPVESAQVCRRFSDASQVAAFRYAIRNGYEVLFYVDGIPVRVPIGIIQRGVLSSQVEGMENHGVGEQEGDGDKSSRLQNRYLLATHLHFDVGYNYKYIVEANITIDPEKFIDVTDAKPRIITFTLSASYFSSAVRIEDRIVRVVNFASDEHLEVQWFSVMNSFIVVFLLCGALGLFLARIVRRDRQRFSADIEEEQIESGWKKLSGDVFKFPAHKSFFSAAFGVGCQLFVVALSLTLLAMLGFFPHAGLGSWIATILIAYTLTVGLGGWISGSFYRKIGGDLKRWARHFVVTALLFPGPSFIVWAFINIVAIFYGSTVALPMKTVFWLFVVMLAVACPLTLLGVIHGKRDATPLEQPCETRETTRPIPALPWLMGKLFQMFVSGCLPFSAIYVELYYLFISVWGHGKYTIPTIVFFAFFLLFLAIGCVSIAMTYLNLSCNNHRWWEMSFFNSGSVAVYLFFYGIYFLIFESDMTGTLQISYFIGYTLIASFAFFLITGAFGFYVSLWFVRRLYSFSRNE